jgi:hypothetical protein
MRRDWRCYLALACSLVTAVFAPHSLFGVDAAHQRFAPFVLPFFALTLARSSNAPRRKATLAFAWLGFFALAWTAGVACRMRVFEAEARGFSSLLAQMEPGQRALSINFSPDSRAFAGPVFLHHAAWYSALKSGIVDPSFACSNVDLILYRPEAIPAVRFADFEFHPRRFDWREHEGQRYRYFVVHARVEKSARLFADAGVPVLLRASDGDWWLYENTAHTPFPVEGPVGATRRRSPTSVSR